jgi:tetratricopeptide (TPR) repeat protein
LVRGAACVALETLPSREAFQALVKATGDDYRLVRVRAAGSLSRITTGMARVGLNDEDRKKVQSATEELIASYTSRPDQWTSHYNLGNYYFNQRRPDLALAAFQTALKFEPRAVAVLVNTSMAYSHLNKNKEAEGYLVKALEIDPKSAEANFNMGLLRAEQKDLKKAEEHLRAALKADETMHPAAYNLGVMLAKDKPKESIKLLHQAFKITPTPKYGYTLAFFMQKHGDLENSGKMLEKMIEQWPQFGDAYLLLGDIYQRQDNKDKAVALYQKAIGSERLSPQDKERITVELNKLDSATKEGK